MVHLDLRHLGKKHLEERLPLICGLARRFANTDPITTPIPVRPAVHYTMGGIRTDINSATGVTGLWALGECSSVGMHGANRLGSNSLSEIAVFGKVAGPQAMQHAKDAGLSDRAKLDERAREILNRIDTKRAQKGDERLADVSHAMALSALERKESRGSHQRINASTHRRL